MVGPCGLVNAVRSRGNLRDMGFFEDQFKSDFLFDNEYRQRRDLQDLQNEAIETAATTHALSYRVQQLETTVNQLQLLANALVSVIETKQLATREELEVLVQQIDLLDGREDGKLNPEAWSEAPRCKNCNHYVNPSREVCLYCGSSLALQGATVGGPYRGGASAENEEPPPRTATCAACGTQVPQSMTYFTDQGELHCTGCYSG